MADFDWQPELLVFGSPDDFAGDPSVTGGSRRRHTEWGWIAPDPNGLPLDLPGDLPYSRTPVPESFSATAGGIPIVTRVQRYGADGPIGRAPLPASPATPMSPPPPYDSHNFSPPSSIAAEPSMSYCDPPPDGTEDRTLPEAGSSRPTPVRTRPAFYLQGFQNESTASSGSDDDEWPCHDYPTARAFSRSRMRRADSRASEARQTTQQVLSETQIAPPSALNQEWICVPRSDAPAQARHLRNGIVRRGQLLDLLIPIIDFADNATRLTLRAVSRKARNAVDNHFLGAELVIHPSARHAYTLRVVESRDVSWVAPALSPYSSVEGRRLALAGVQRVEIRRLEPSIELNGLLALLPPTVKATVHHAHLSDPAEVSCASSQTASVNGSRPRNDGSGTNSDEALPVGGPRRCVRVVGFHPVGPANGRTPSAPPEPVPPPPTPTPIYPRLRHHVLPCVQHLTIYYNQPCSCLTGGAGLEWIHADIVSIRVSTLSMALHTCMMTRFVALGQQRLVEVRLEGIGLSQALERWRQQRFAVEWNDGYATAMAEERRNAHVLDWVNIGRVKVVMPVAWRRQRSVAERWVAEALGVDMEVVESQPSRRRRATRRDVAF